LAGAGDEIELVRTWCNIAARSKPDPAGVDLHGIDRDVGCLGVVAAGALNDRLLPSVNQPQASPMPWLVLPVLVLPAGSKLPIAVLSADQISRR